MDGTGSFANSLQRSHGKLDIAFREHTLGRLYQSGSAKVLLPRSYGSAHEIVLVNTAGGITGGDSYHYGFATDASNILVTTQAAERAYASNTTDIASMHIELSAKNCACLHWLPQETILFDKSRLARSIEIDIDSSSECMVLESLVFGRHATGEILDECYFTDHWRIRRNGQLIHGEAVRLDQTISDLLAGGAGAACAQMAATLVYVGPRLKSVKVDIELNLPKLKSRVAMSVWQDRLVLRMLASQAMAGKADLLRILTAIRRQQVPRVWQS